MQVDQTDAIFDQFARITAALAAPSRLKLLDRLAQGEQTVEELAAGAALTVSNASRQLRILADAGLAGVRRDPPRVFYRIADGQVLEFWFALRRLARARLAELDRIVGDLVSARDALQPISREELLERMQHGGTLLIDVRPSSEYRAGHIPGALSLPVGELATALPHLADGRQVVAYCRGPFCLLSVDAVEILRAAGIPAVRLEDGFPEWKAAGLPVQLAAGAG